jgi:hypothetical protein
VAVSFIGGGNQSTRDNNYVNKYLTQEKDSKQILQKIFLIWCNPQRKHCVLLLIQGGKFQAYGGTWSKMSFLHFHGGYIDSKHPTKLFCLILPNKGIMAIFVIL